jgi:hypothetical protein
MTMADDSSDTGFFGFVLGGVLVVMAIMAFVIYGGQGTGPKTVNLDLPQTAPTQTR